MINELQNKVNTNQNKNFFFVFLTLNKNYESKFIKFIKRYNSNFNGLWGYFESESKAITALIPVIIGTILLLVNKGVKNENKALAHVAVYLHF